MARRTHEASRPDEADQVREAALTGGAPAADEAIPAGAAPNPDGAPHADAVPNPDTAPALPLAEQARRIVATLTDDQKAQILAGASFWRTIGIPKAGIEAQTLSDGPHGLRKQQGVADNMGLNSSIPATCFPTASALACSFDADLLREVGRALGEECRKEDVSVLLGPGVNIKRSPLCGRNFEYFSEDPLLAGALASAYIQGVQAQGVGTSIKHFAANSQEKARMISDSVVDERTLNEIYLRPFELAVRTAQPWTVMTAYNRLNGSYCSENPRLIQDKLRGEWGFKGACVTDWGALSDSVASVNAGLDLCMPGPRVDHSAAVARAQAHGKLAEGALDAAAAHVVELGLRHAHGRTEPYTCNMVEHARLARRAAASSAVLLKNEGALPLVPDVHVAVIGAFAKKPRYQGAGSSKINPFDLDDAWSSLLAAGVRATFSLGYESQSGSTSEDLLQHAEETAREADVAIVFAGLPDRFESEGYDRTSMGMPAGHCLLIDRVCAANPRTVVVLCGGAPFDMPWRDKPAAILLMYLSGSQGGEAIADLITGRVSPSGKLAETWPERVGDTFLGSDFPVREREVLYREGLYVGYRYFEALDVRPAYPFGHGLSYARFAYGDVSVTCDDGQLTAHVPVRNVGSCDAAETVQIYVSPQAPTVFYAPQALAGFAKATIPAGAERLVSVPLDGHAFGYWDVAHTCWRVDAGCYDVRAAASSADVRSTCTIELAAGQAIAGFPGERAADGAPVSLVVSERAQVPDDVKARLAPYFWPMADGFTREAFEALYARPLPRPLPQRPYSVNTVLGDIGDTFVGRKLLKAIVWYSHTVADEATRAMIDAMMEDMPLRSITMAGVSQRFLHGLVDILNGHYVSGLRRFLGKK